MSLRCKWSNRTQLSVFFQDKRISQAVNYELKLLFILYYSCLKNRETFQRLNEKIAKKNNRCRQNFMNSLDHFYDFQCQ